MKEKEIKGMIDAYLTRWIDIRLNRLPLEVEKEMADPNENSKEEWRTWLPIDSRVTDIELEAFEMQIGHQFPPDYKTFLKHKHFYELHISEASFCRHPVNTWRLSLVKMIFDGYPREYLVDRGVVPFADWSDWGLLCFDTNRNDGHNNYPIVLWDHEMAAKFQDFSPNFYEMLIKLDEEDKDSRN